MSLNYSYEMSGMEIKKHQGEPRQISETRQVGAIRGVDQKKDQRAGAKAGEREPYIPRGAAIPFTPGIVRSPRKPQYSSAPTAQSRARVRRNFNESPLERLFLKNKINQEQYGIAIRYRACYLRAYPAQSHQYREWVDGAGGGRGVESMMDAETRILRCGQLMDPVFYKALQLLVIDECEPWVLSERFSGERGWSRSRRMERIREVLNTLSQIWPQTKG